MQHNLFLPDMALYRDRTRGGCAHVTKDRSMKRCGPSCQAGGDELLQPYVNGAGEC